MATLGVGLPQAPRVSQYALWGSNQSNAAALIDSVILCKMVVIQQ